MFAGQVAAEGLLHLHVHEKERWKRGENGKVHQNVVDVLEAAWGGFVTPPGSKHHYLTLGHLETVFHYYIHGRDPWQVEPLTESGRVLAERATVFQWPSAKGELLTIGGKPDIPAIVCGTTAIVDWKCSTQYITDYWAKKFHIGHQLRTYIAMLRHEYGIKVDTAYVDGIHMGVKAAEGDAAWKNLKSVRSKLFGPYHFDEQQMEETWTWYKTGLELQRFYAENGHYPQNEGACGNYGGCEFGTLCSRSPRSRAAKKMSEYIVRPEHTGALLSGADSE